MKVISVENVSKKFILAHDRPRNLADASRALFRGRQREDFWALKDVSFEVEQGEALGIIGHNGAGKSTMLKLLTRIMQPTNGRIRTRGRVSALIEIGAGFHPEMTGRENIYLNGSILGMTRREIDRKFDEIVTFAELEKFIDTPVKRYSSGMYVRLGFAVAANTEPEFLLVDEVLSVGDAAFQAKCLEKMENMLSTGVSMVLVSHNLGIVETFCSRAAVLAHGSLISLSGSREAVNHYIDIVRDSASDGVCGLPVVSSSVIVEQYDVMDNCGEVVKSLAPGEGLTIRLSVNALEPIKMPEIRLGIYDNRFGTLCLASSDDTLCSVLGKGHHDVRCVFDKLPFRPRDYQIWIGIRSRLENVDRIPWQRLGYLNIVDQTGPALGTDRLFSPVAVPYSYEIRDIYPGITCRKESPSQ